ncbi:ATP-binding protein [Streptomyces sp. NPDC059002]|uniref:ATP-binding protein n=1 Tax=Streptomyces sp. NPDC059002 TaxID=3346690 RepID=UPI003693BF04
MPPRLVVDTACVVWRWTGSALDGAACARTALRCALDQLGLDGEGIGDAMLTVSELVANASEHAPGPYELRIRRTAAGLICEVEDGDPRIPEIPPVPATGPYGLPRPEGCGGGLDALLELLSERGRGLHVVEQLTQGAWGFRSDPDAGVKVAWFALSAAPLSRGGAL